MTESDHEPSLVGEALRRARHDQGLGIEDAARESGLSESMVRRLEQVDPAEWGTDARVLAALRIYARTLGHDPEPTVTAAWRRARANDRRPARQPVAPLLPPGAERRGQRRRRRLLVAVAVAVPILLAGSAAVLARGGGEAPRDGPPAAQTDDDDGAQGDEGPADDDTGDAGDAGDAGDQGADETAAADGLPGRPPNETPVQVLNALADEQATAEAVDLLESLGYDIVLVDSTREVWDQTAAYYEPGWEAEADSLHARDGRFVVGGPNDVFVDEAGLHVVVGQDWAGQQ